MGSKRVGFFLSEGLTLPLLHVENPAYFFIDELKTHTSYTLIENISKSVSLLFTTSTVKQREKKNISIYID